MDPSRAESGLLNRPISEIAPLIRSRKVSPVELTEMTLARIERFGAHLNCFITVAADLARRQAQSAEALLEGGVYLGDLHGVPISIKDNIDTARIRTTVGTPIFADRIPDRNASLVDRLYTNGAVLIAKDNMYDFAYCGPNPRFGPTHNPWDLSRSCAGSSSGSAAAVASCLSFGSVGTDGGGSIRAPAAFCGVVGLKPTFGLIDATGEFPLNPTLSMPGPITRSVRDAATLLQTLVSGSSRQPRPNYLDRIDNGVVGLRLGVLRRVESEPIDPEIGSVLDRAYDVLARDGATLIEIELPDFELARTVMWAVSGVEVAECIRPYTRGRMQDLHPVTRMLVERAEFIPATYYIHAQRVRQRLIAQVGMALAGLDALLLPTCPIAAYPIGTTVLTVNGREEDALDLFTRYTALFNVTGLPALTIPCGFTTKRLPIGLQIGGRAFSEAKLLRIAEAYERLTPWHKLHPALEMPAR